MKFSPTPTLALVLAAGLTAAVAAPTTSATTMDHPQAAPAALANATQPAPSCGAARINPSEQSLAAEAQRYTDQVKEAQERLHAAGLYNGPADGIMEQDTRAALTRFQEQNGLQRTGRIDRPTMARLMAGPSTNTGSSQPSSGTAPAGAGGDAASRR